jgi:hypothetical protein
MSFETKQKIAAIYANAAAAHTSDAVVQQEINAVIAASPQQYSATSNPVTANQDQANLIDTTA